MSASQKPVFIQGLTRSRTTYFWSKFRSDPKNYCFYEPLHPLLVDQRPHPSQVVSASILRHPPLKKFVFAEYPLIVRAPIDLGVRRYFLSKDEEVPELEKYFNSLIDLATGRPIFKLVRLALRGEWLAQKFHGNHIYLDRDLTELVNSYYSFRGRQSWYLKELITIVGANTEGKIFGELAHYLGLESKEGSYQDLRDYYQKVTQDKFSQGEYTRQKMVDLVAFLREIALFQAQKYATLIVTGGDFLHHREYLEDVLFQLTGTKVDFSDFKFRPKSLEVFPSPEVIKIIERAKSEIDR